MNIHLSDRSQRLHGTFQTGPKHRNRRSVAGSIIIISIISIVVVVDILINIYLTSLIFFKDSIIISYLKMC